MASSRRVPHMGREAAAAQPRPKNRGHWTDREHSLFLAGLEEFGTDYARLARMIGSRTATQVRTHSQKYFIKLKKQASGGNGGEQAGTGVVGEWTIPKPQSAARLAQLPELLRKGSPQLMDIAVNPAAEKAFCQWLYEHWDNPFPNKAQKRALAQQSHVSLQAVTTWFVSARAGNFKPLWRHGNSDLRTGARDRRARASGSGVGGDSTLEPGMVTEPAPASGPVRGLQSGSGDEGSTTTTSSSGRDSPLHSSEAAQVLMAEHNAQVDQRRLTGASNRAAAAAWMDYFGHGAASGHEDAVSPVSTPFSPRSNRNLIPGCMEVGRGTGVPESEAVALCLLGLVARHDNPPPRSESYGDLSAAASGLQASPHAMSPMGSTLRRTDDGPPAGAAATEFTYIVGSGEWLHTLRCHHEALCAWMLRAERACRHGLGRDDIPTLQEYLDVAASLVREVDEDLRPKNALLQSLIGSLPLTSSAYVQVAACLRVAGDIDAAHSTHFSNVLRQLQSTTWHLRAAALLGDDERNGEAASASMHGSAADGAAGAGDDQAAAAATPPGHPPRTPRTFDRVEAQRLVEDAIALGIRDDHVGQLESALAHAPAPAHVAPASSVSSLRLQDAVAPPAAASSAGGPSLLDTRRVPPHTPRTSSPLRPAPVVTRSPLGSPRGFPPDALSPRHSPARTPGSARSSSRALFRLPSPRGKRPRTPSFASTSSRSRRESVSSAGDHRRAAVAGGGGGGGSSSSRGVAMDAGSKHRRSSSAASAAGSANDRVALGAVSAWSTRAVLALASSPSLEQLTILASTAPPAVGDVLRRAVHQETAWLQDAAQLGSHHGAPVPFSFVQRLLAQGAVMSSALSAGVRARSAELRGSFLQLVVWMRRAKAVLSCNATAHASILTSTDPPLKPMRLASPDGVDALAAEGGTFFPRAITEVLALARALCAEADRARGFARELRQRASSDASLSVDSVDSTAGTRAVPVAALRSAYSLVVDPLPMFLHCPPLAGVVPPLELDLEAPGVDDDDDDGDGDGGGRARASSSTSAAASADGSHTSSSVGVYSSAGRESVPQTPQPQQLDVHGGVFPLPAASHAPFDEAGRVRMPNKRPAHSPVQAAALPETRVPTAVAAPATASTTVNTTAATIRRSRRLPPRRRRPSARLRR